MLLNLGLTADAAAAHTNDPQLDSPPANCPYTTAFSLSALPFLGTLYSINKQADGLALPAGPASEAMSPVAFASEGESSKDAAPSTTRPRGVNPAYTVPKLSRPKTIYQFAHPASHARHKRLKLRPKLLLQLQQVSQTPRPLPILDILPSTLYLPRLARKFPAMFRGRNGLGPNDLIIVKSELYDRKVASIPEKHTSSEDEDDDHREVLATICQMLREDARSKGKAEICLNFGPTWEATPLPSGSYEFVARTDNGVQVVRWALRGGKNRRVSAPAGAQVRDDTKRFTFSVIDPTTRRHPVIASMTKNQLEVFDEYAAVVRSHTGTGTGTTTPSSARSVISDMSDEEPSDTNKVTLEDSLRTLIVITGIWVAFREGWSQNFSYNDPLFSPTAAKSLVSPTSSRYSSPARNENDTPIDRDDLSPMKETLNGGKRCMSVSSVRRSNSVAPTDGSGFGSLSKRSNSTGATFMDRAKRRSASGVSTRLNRHSMFTGTGEAGHEIVISRPSSRPPSLRQSSIEPEDLAPPKKFNRKSKPQPLTENSKLSSKPDRATPTPQVNHHARNASPQVETKDPEADTKGKRRHRLSNIFTIFHRKHGAH
ncbi:hypothetical protein N7448_001224 [Penicillium atrosanguineum]|uniref:Uncharacterized protein n=1 Tax=Penicillium atrosanguineum TaxID=1132637 RepID=A0A9W9Q680_9EURO|nr:hypothetical protein N7526_005120 [Penicillium atrosanguineum]KAJ5149646.1 hypothetical protein N7448_001224 [Penicillium atrosanguineum]KAJ5324428.1 hypothetical protein N7476_003028 [Penicillium atrosanguineum]